MEKPNVSSILATLKVVTKQKDLQKGILIHDELLKTGLIENNIYVGTQFITFYARCGELVKGKNVFDLILVRNIVSWTALMGGYNQHELYEESIHCFEQMQQEGISPDAFAYVCILKTYANIGASEKGKEIHARIAVGEELIEKNVLVGTSLVDMYAKFGKLAKAQEMLDEILIRDVISWNVIITGYVQHGYGEEALMCYEQMQWEGLSPNVVTFVCILKACGLIRALDNGKHVHSRINGDGLLEQSILLGNALVDMYAKCGSLSKAHQVFCSLLVRDVVSWNSIIAGHVLHGHGQEALYFFQEMQYDGISPNGTTFVYALRACESIGAIDEGEKLHDKIAREGFLENDIFLGTALMNMYAKCGDISKSQEVFDHLLVRDVVIWTALIAGCANHGDYMKAHYCFRQMQQECFLPDVFTLVGIVRLCGTVRAYSMGKEIHVAIGHDNIRQNELLFDTAMVDMYAKCGILSQAQELFDEIPIHDVASWNALAGGYVQQGYGENALNCFKRMQCEGILPDTVSFIYILKACRIIGMGKRIHVHINEQGGLWDKNVQVGTALVDMYGRCHAFSNAREVFTGFQIHDTISWNVRIAGYMQHSDGAEALSYFHQMQQEGILPDLSTFSCVVKVCGVMGACKKGEEIYAVVVREILRGENVVIGDAFVDMYAKCGELAKAKKVFENLPVKDVINWTVLIAGYARHGQGEIALDCFETMQVEGITPNVVTFSCILKACGSLSHLDKGREVHSEIVSKGFLEEYVLIETSVEEIILIGNALVDMYAKCGSFSEAQKVFEELSIQDVISWNFLIEGYLQQGHEEQVLNCFRQMRQKCVPPDAFSFLCVLKACIGIGALDSGKRIHAEISGKVVNNLIRNTIISMYAKYGAIAMALQLFNQLPSRDVVSWTSLISGYMHIGKEDIVDDLLNQMVVEDGILPNTLTFTILLKTCSHSGELEKGQMYFRSMKTIYRIVPTFEHYTCMVDLFARAGQFEKAMDVIERMPMADFLPVWSSLYGACQQWGTVKDGPMAFEGDSASYVYV